MTVPANVKPKGDDIRRKGSLCEAQIQSSEKVHSTAPSGSATIAKKGPPGQWALGKHPDKLKQIWRLGLALNGFTV